MVKNSQSMLHSIGSIVGLRAGGIFFLDCNESVKSNKSWGYQDAKKAYLEHPKLAFAPRNG